MSNYFDTLLSTVGLATPVQPAPMSAAPAPDGVESSDFSEVSVETVAPSPSLHSSARQFTPSANSPDPAALQSLAAAPHVSPHTPPPSTANTLPLPAELTQNADSAALLQQVLAWLSREPQAAAPTAPIVAASVASAEESATTTNSFASPVLTATRSLRPADTPETTALNTSQTVETLARSTWHSESTRPSLIKTAAHDEDRATMPIVPSSPAEQSPSTIAPAAPRPSFVTPTHIAAPLPAVTTESSLNVSIGSIHVKIEGPASAPATINARPVATPRPFHQAPAASTRARSSNRLSRHAL